MMLLNNRMRSRFRFQMSQRSFRYSRNAHLHATVGWGFVKQQFKYLSELPRDRTNISSDASVFNAMPEHMT